MKVSIIIPVFNRAAILQKTLDSVVNQSYQDWECIIVDDGSTDQTMPLLNKLAGKDLRFRVFQRDETKVKGASSCRNTGLEQASGEFVIFFDSDDELLPHCLENRIELFTKNQKNDFIVFPMGIYFNENHIKKKEIANKDSYLIDFLSYTLPWQTMCPIWRTSFVRSLNGFSEGYPRLNDPELMIRAFLIPDVSFKVFSDVPYDTVYYPSVSNWVLMIDKYYNSLQLFIPDISKELERREKTEFKKYLKGYLKVWYRDFFFPSNKNLVTQNRNLIKLFRKNGIITLWTSLALSSRFYMFIILSHINRKIKNSQITNLG